MLTKDQTAEIQRETSSQSYSPSWCEERHSGITNSLLGQVCRWFSSTQPDFLVNSILNQHGTHQCHCTVPWGKNNEVGTLSANKQGLLRVGTPVLMKQYRGLYKS